MQGLRGSTSWRQISSEAWVAEDVLIVPIRPINQGTVAGTATIQEEDESLNVTVFLVP